MKRLRPPEERRSYEGWPPNIREFVTEQQSEILLPAPFSPQLEPRQLGNLYEIRTYTLKPGSIPGVIDRWSTQLAERIKLSMRLLVLCRATTPLRERRPGKMRATPRNPDLPQTFAAPALALS